MKLSIEGQTIWPLLLGPAHDIGIRVGGARGDLLSSAVLAPHQVDWRTIALSLLAPC